MSQKTINLIGGVGENCSCIKEMSINVRGQKINEIGLMDKAKIIH